MKQYTTYQIQKNISKYLLELPFEIIKFNKVVARVISPMQETDTNEVEKLRKENQRLLNQLFEKEEKKEPSKPTIEDLKAIAGGFKPKEITKTCFMCNKYDYTTSERAITWYEDGDEKNEIKPVCNKCFAKYKRE